MSGKYQERLIDQCARLREELALFEQAVKAVNTDEAMIACDEVENTLDRLKEAHNAWYARVVGGAQ